jgi:hypothetical protein
MYLEFACLAVLVKEKKQAHYECKEHEENIFH